MESSEWSTNSKSSKLSASLCGLCGFSPPFNLIASAMSTDSRQEPRKGLLFALERGADLVERCVGSRAGSRRGVVGLAREDCVALKPAQGRELVGGVERQGGQECEGDLLHLTSGIPYGDEHGLARV